jgi:hypothetical protein
MLTDPQMKRNIVGLVLGLLIVVLIDVYFPHSSDRVLIANFRTHEADFDVLVKMLNENPNIQIIASSFASFVNRADWPNPTYLHEDQSWPRPESELGFTQHRWDEYRRLFKKIKLESGMRRKDELTEVIFFTASTDFTSNKDGEGVVTEKGYAYSPTPIYHSLTDCLDNIESDRSAIFFKRLNDKWYLYYEYSISHPE